MVDMINEVEVKFVWQTSRPPCKWWWSVWVANKSEKMFSFIVQYRFYRFEAHLLNHFYWPSMNQFFFIDQNDKGHLSVSAGACIWAETLYYLGPHNIYHMGKKVTFRPSDIVNNCASSKLLTFPLGRTKLFSFVAFETKTILEP